MTSAEREVDMGGRDPHSNNALDFVIEHSNDSKDPRHSDVDLCKLTVCFAVIYHQAPYVLNPFFAVIIT